MDADVTDPAQVTGTVQQAEDHFSGVDVLVNNAGYGYRAAVEEGEEDEVAQLFGAELGEPRLARSHDRVGQRPLLIDHLTDPLLDRALAHELVHVDRAVLADAPRPVGCLILDGRVPHVVLLELFSDAGIGTMVTA